MPLLRKAKKEEPEETPKTGFKKISFPRMEDIKNEVDKPKDEDSKEYEEINSEEAGDFQEEEVQEPGVNKSKASWILTQRPTQAIPIFKNNKTGQILTLDDALNEVILIILNNPD